jgi:hypothetical protein
MLKLKGENNNNGQITINRKHRLGSDEDDLCFFH